MATNSLPDFSDLKSSSDYFYTRSCELDAAVDQFINARKSMPGMNLKKVARLYDLLKHAVDDLFLLSAELDSMHLAQQAALGVRERR